MEEFSNNDMWHKALTIKNGKVVVKRIERGKFLGSTIIPTVYYPLTGTPEIFSCDTTETVQDKRVLQLIDEVEAKIGYCYQNTKAVSKVLKENGFNNVKTYAGWLFTSESQVPVHHAWVVLNGKHVIDLTDDFPTIFSLIGSNPNKNQNANDIKEQFIKAIQFAQSLPNSIRCAPIGQPSPMLFYVGAECDPDKAKAEYQRLLQTYPDHETARNVGKDGLNATQRALRSQGGKSFE